MASGTREGQHLLQHRQGHPRLVAEAGHKSVTRIEVSISSRLRGERIVVAVVLADEISVLPIPAGASELLNPSVPRRAGQPAK